MLVFAADTAWNDTTINILCQEILKQLREEAWDHYRFEKRPTKDGRWLGKREFENFYGQKAWQTAMWREKSLLWGGARGILMRDMRCSEVRDMRCSEDGLWYTHGEFELWSQFVYGRDNAHYAWAAAENIGTELAMGLCSHDTTDAEGHRVLTIELPIRCLLVGNGGPFEKQLAWQKEQAVRVAKDRIGSMGFVEEHEANLGLLH